MNSTMNRQCYPVLIAEEEKKKTIFRYPLLNLLIVFFLLIPIVIVIVFVTVQNMGSSNEVKTETESTVNVSDKTQSKEEKEKAKKAAEEKAAAEKLPCARRLEDVIYPYEVHATETFVKFKEQVLDESWHVMEQDMVDLTPVVEELLLVEIPMQVFSEDALEMSNLPRGKEWEMKTEEGNLLEQIAKEPKVDPRLAGLANFFDEKKED